jgi:hypothetical protein
LINFVIRVVLVIIIVTIIVTVTVIINKENNWIYHQPENKI